MITPFDDFIYIVNNVFFGEEPTIEDFVLLVGTLVAFVAFVLWCCFPIGPEEQEVEEEELTPKRPKGKSRRNQRKNAVNQYK